MLRLFKRHLIACVFAGLLAACGGGGSGEGGSAGGGGGGSAGGGGGGSVGTAPTQAEAARLLTQATFGPTESSIQAVVSSGSVDRWITTQISAAPASTSHLAHIDAVIAAAGNADDNEFYQTWWRQAISGNDQLRQRVAFALSQIFVISLNDDVIDARGAASYYDMLTRNALGNYRTLLKDVTLHPMMGRYLTYLGNQKEDAAGTRTPDENYAREVMQLMTIGLVELNADGTQRLNGTSTVPTYTSADIAGLAKVFTGISWYHPTPTNSTFFGGSGDPNRTVNPMIYYPNYHSTSEKVFLGTTIPASATVNVGGDIDLALDRLFNHANTAPFISQRLIQQLVTSNPSPAYVGRVAAVFANNGSGVRGDLGAVVRAILTDTEARGMSAAVASASFGKLREPIVRLANWARAFGATSQTGNYLITSTSSNTSFNQTPLSSPSVFNFWRPGFTPPGTTQLGQRTLVAPEFQIVDEVTVASYINTMQDVIANGIGQTPSGGSGRDVRAPYTSEIALTDTPSSLVDRMNNLLFYGQMSPTLRDRVIAGVTAVNIPAATGSNQANIDTARLNRARTAVFLSMISPEYLVQR
ncbi:MAG: DUF1800 domain-containing protein [Sphingomonadales bacterium]|nr:MAG: DUF1800 domain-containing protein [Sphingomonadales bacterium]